MLRSGGYRPGGHPRRRGLGRRPAQGRPRRRRGDLRQAQLHRRSSATMCRRPASTVRDGPGARRLSPSTWPTIRDDRTFVLADAAEPDKADVVAALQRDRDRRAAELSAGRQPGGDRILRRMRARGRRRLRQQHPGVHRQRSRPGPSASATPACRSSATTSRRSSARPSSTAC